MAKSPQRGLTVNPTMSASGPWGTHHALIIGINNYKNWPRLQTAVKDATVIRDTLVARYGFAKKNVILRTDKAASRRQIARDLRYLAQSMGQNDNLLVYYAGHGQLDDFTGDGFWVPAEGALKDPDTWVSNSYIKAILSSEKLQAKNVVIIVDSCYSGSMLRGGPSLMRLQDRRYKEKLAQKAALRSRQVISSGGVEPVADGGAEGHSLFAYYLINALRENDREVIDLENLFHTRVWKKVTEIGDQRPNVGRLKTPMDQDGQFVLFNAAWTADQARQHNEMGVHKAEQAKTKAAVAAAELELQRQRIEVEKQRLALEKEQMAQQKALEMEMLKQKQAIELERLKLEKQKQQIEYAKLQARLAEMNQNTKGSTQPQDKAMIAAVSPAVKESAGPVSRKSVQDRYKLALLPMMVISDRANRTEEFENRIIRKGVVPVFNDDERLEMVYTYNRAQAFFQTAELLTTAAAKEELQVWHKRTIFSKYEPDWEKVKSLGPKLNVEIAVLITATFGSGIFSSDVYVYDFANGKNYSQKKVIALGNINSVTRQLIKKARKSR